ncbi:endonuclease domain-containing protein [Microbacterium sp. VKM Ac-2923]|uniref:endonuclease domain-containing protein n=1 Tax=Microbacterium sp. VKM Ac-2923 TaxID=2929476 RepID=UPI001FB1F5B8|nr:endonuclease domain-containing protein [Microbacterium sp. VKM Ac-2923]MCJ1707671.1 endonuclease domain-containing protein [Microbacterium sp. VKM Ac-2923]
MQLLAALSRALPPHAFFCGPTAAVLHGLPLPRPLDAVAWEKPVIGVPSGQNRIRRPRTTGRALTVVPEDIVEVDGIRCTSPLRTWAELAESLGVGQLTAISDRLISRRHPLATRDDLERTHRRFLGGRGSKKRRLAVDLADERAESPRESELRVLLIQAGLPAPESNVEIFDGARFVARVDLLYPAQRLVMEYDGDHHRDPVQWSKDQSRRAELESLGYRMTVVTARDFDDPVALLGRIRRLLAQTPVA